MTNTANAAQARSAPARSGGANIRILDRLAASAHGGRDTQGHLPADDDEEAEHEETSGAAPTKKSKTRARGRGRKA